MRSYVHDFEKYPKNGAMYLSSWERLTGFTTYFGPISRPTVVQPTRYTKCIDSLEFYTNQ